MTKFTDNLWSDLMQEHGPIPDGDDHPQPRRRRRPRVVAGATLGLAAIGAGLVMALSGAAGTTPAFAVTKTSDGSVLVKLDYAQNQNLPQVNAKLAAMGTHEAITIDMARGPAPTPGPVTCTPATGAAAPSGPRVKVLNGPNGTEVIKPGESADNTAEGTFHLNRCVVSNAGFSGNTGAGS